MFDRRARRPSDAGGERAAAPAPRSGRGAAGAAFATLSLRAGAGTEVRRKCGGCAEEDDERDRLHLSARGLALGARDAPAEREADLAAEAALRRSDGLGAEAGAPPARSVDDGTPGLGALQRKAHAGAVPRGAARLPSALPATGRPLAPDIRERMEQGFGQDFSGVRVHTGDAAAQASRRLHARAFSYGDHVAFDAGEYRPGTPEGDRLLAHELAHTLQHRAARGAASALRREPKPSATSDGDAENASELEDPGPLLVAGSGGLMLCACDCGGGRSTSDKDAGPTPTPTAPPTEEKKEEPKKEEPKKEEPKKDEDEDGATPILKDGVWTFPTAKALDVRKEFWKKKFQAKAASKPDDIVKWLMGDPDETSAKRDPETNPFADPDAIQEVQAQQKALVDALTSAAPPGLTSAKKKVLVTYRNYAAQAGIWKGKWNFTTEDFDVVSKAAEKKCAIPEVKAGEKWNPKADPKKQAAQKKCWEKTLDDDDRAREILQASSAPGVSRHHWGTDFDFWSVEPEDWAGTGKQDLTSVYAWLKLHASNFGFMQAFAEKPKASSPADPYGIRYFAERWHWSYYPVSQALLEVSQDPAVRAALKKALEAKWGTDAPFKYIKGKWESYMDEVNTQASFTIPPGVKTGGADPPKDEYRIVKVAWSMDDGPTKDTPAMAKAMGDRPTTYFIMRTQIGTGADQAKKLADLKTLQDNGSEIAIHSSHPTVGHASWFPVKVAGAVPKAYTSIADSMKDLADFTALLRGASLRVKFVRFPGGEITEVSAYLKAEGVTGTDVSRTARMILKREDVSSESAAVKKVDAEFKVILDKLDALGLKLWGGTATGAMITSQSWEAESSGTGLTDNVTDEFKKIVDSFGKVKRPRSLIVLAHDTDPKNVTEVSKDIAEMEDYAKKNGVQIWYMSMRGLFKNVRGVAP